MKLAARTHTVADLLDPADEQLYELVDGVLVAKPPSVMVSWLNGVIAARIGNFVDTSGGTAWTLMHMPLACGSNIRRPGVSYLAAPPPRERWDDEVMTDAPDWCIDVFLPDADATEVERRLSDYRLAGVRLLWQVFLRTRTIVASDANGTAAVLTDGGTLTGGDVLPGFSVAVTDVLPPREG